MIKYLLAFAMLCSLPAMAQDFDKVKAAFETGNVSELRPYLDATVELSIDGKEMEVGRGDAETQLRSFFDQHPPRSFSVLHSGASKSDVHYVIGSYLATDGEFRISAYMSKTGETFLIQSLEIEAN